MAGSHRDAEAKVRTLGARSVIVLVVAVVAAIAFGSWVVDGLLGGPSPGDDSPSSSRTPAPAASSGSPSVSPRSSPAAPTTTASDVPSPSADLPDIPAESPRRLRSEGLIDAGFDTAVTTGTDRLTAASASELSRLGDRGRPGSPGTDTVVLVGEDRFDRQAALNRIGDLRTGDTIELETYNADLTYTIEKSLKLDVSAVLGDKVVSAKVPGRLVLVATTYDDTGNRANQDTVVVARLTSAETR